MMHKTWKIILLIPVFSSLLSCGSGTETTSGLTVAIVPKASVIVPGKTKSCDAVINAKDADVVGPRVAYRQVLLKWEKNQPLYIVEMKFVFKPPNLTNSNSSANTQFSCSISLDEMNSLFSNDANYIKGGEIRASASGNLQILSNSNCNWHCSGFPVNFDSTTPITYTGALKILAYTIDSQGSQSMVKAETPVTADYNPY